MYNWNTQRYVYHIMRMQTSKHSECHSPSRAWSLQTVRQCHAVEASMIESNVMFCRPIGSGTLSGLWLTWKFSDKSNNALLGTHKLKWSWEINTPTEPIEKIPSKTLCRPLSSVTWSRSWSTAITFETIGVPQPRPGWLGLDRKFRHSDVHSTRQDKNHCMKSTSNSLLDCNRNALSDLASCARLQDRYASKVLHPASAISTSGRWTLNSTARA